ncbi:acyl-CoA N-acyltransferase [Phyllosticta paracitricarpa]
MSQFISFLAPTPTITNYDRTQHATEQTAANIPQTFKDAMTVRERVFVEEQNIALENEFDADDARSFHWVVYASVGATGTTNGFKPGAPAAAPAAPNGESTTTTTTTTKTEADAQEERRRSDPSAHRVAVGTVRLVPPPHPPHPAPSDSHALDNSLAAPATFAAAAAAANGANGTASASSPNGHNHSHTTTAIAPPYIKLGRLAILQPYRKLGLARLLVRTALDWAAQHPHLLCPPPSPEAVELAKVEGREGALDGWDGRALVHAQVHLEKFYASFGFVRDESMGIWDEEGIDHVGMWLTLKLR